MKSEFRWYRNKQKIVHSRKESWFDSDEKEKVYKDNFIRVKGEVDLSVYVAPKPKPKPKTKAKAKKVKKGSKK